MDPIDDLVGEGSGGQCASAFDQHGGHALLCGPGKRQMQVDTPILGGKCPNLGPLVRIRLAPVGRILLRGDEDRAGTSVDPGFRRSAQAAVDDDGSRVAAFHVAHR